MRKYQNKAVRELASELCAGLVRLRKGYVDAAEEFLSIVQPDQEYPLDLVRFRLTGYRPQRRSGPDQTIRGRQLRPDLQTLVLDVCDSFDLRTTDYGETIHDLAGLARRYNVATKTVQRWRARGLVARRLVFPDGKRRLAFLAGSVDRFVRPRENLVGRSSRFSQLDEAERADIVRRARRMGRRRGATLSEVARRIARTTGRAVETVRYTIRKHDADHPTDAAFPVQPAEIQDEQKIQIYQSLLRGESATQLARRHRRSRGSIYRIASEVRASRLVVRLIDYVYSPAFELPNADELILAAPTSPADRRRQPRPRAPEDLPAYLQALYEVPLLTPQQEQDLFRRYNYLKYCADKARKKLDPKRLRTKDLRHVEGLLLEANVVKNQIVRANLRLVVSIAKRHLGGPMSLFELISDGNVALMRAVEKFDYSKGFRFSTYASWAIMRNFARTVPRERFQLDHFATGHDEVLDIAASLKVYDPNDVNLPELRESLDAVMGKLSDLERSILIEHYGLDEDGGTKTLETLGKSLGLSKERVRQIELRALRKLRSLLRPAEAPV